jgi:hypothetical protein
LPPKADDRQCFEGGTIRELADRAEFALLLNQFGDEISVGDAVSVPGKLTASPTVCLYHGALKGPFRVVTAGRLLKKKSVQKSGNVLQM